MKNRPFSIRCANAIAEGKLNPDVATEKLRLRLWRLLVEFNLPCIVKESRYDAREIHSDAFYEIQQQLVAAYEAIGKDTNFTVDQLFLERAETATILDLLELWSDFLGADEGRHFERAVNELFDEEQFPWLVMEGRVFRVDRGFVEHEIVEPIFEALRGSAFAGALDEFSDATAQLTAGDTKAAIQSAAKSFESVLKAITGGQGTALQLIRKLNETSLFSDLPDDVAATFPETVLAALPHVRNKLSGHGQGQSVVNVAPIYAELALHLSAVFSLFLIRAQARASKKQVASPEWTDDDSVPF